MSDEQSEIQNPKPESAARRRREVAFALAAIVLAIGLAEGSLRLLGFRFTPVPILPDSAWGPTQLQAMNQSMGRELFRPDDLLFWSMIPGTRLDVRQVNEMGLLNGPIAVPKPAATYRILCLGDSCTAFGPVAYPTVLQERLDAMARPDRRFEVINGGVFSYSSLQGFRLLCYRLDRIEPNLVTVYYGWNDHYLTSAYPDKMLRSREAAAAGTVRLLRHLRLYQFVQRVVNTMQAQRIAEQRKGQRLVRVEPDDYRRNLSAIVDVAGKRGARVVLLTAPSNHKAGRVPLFFLESRLAESEEALIARHRSYNEIVRQVAGEKKVELLDLEAAFGQQNKDELFMRDGVHPNPRGRRFIAELLLARLAEMNVVSLEERRHIAQAQVYDSSEPNVLRSRIEFLDQPLRAVIGRPLTLAVRATNTGDTVWLARSKAEFGHVLIGVLVFDAQGRHLFAKEWGALPGDVRPGETIEVRWTLSPFTQAGRYVLEVDPVAEKVAWFNDVGDERTTTVLVVEESGESNERSR